MMKSAILSLLIASASAFAPASQVRNGIFEVLSVISTVASDPD